MTAEGVIRIGVCSVLQKTTLTYSDNTFLSCLLLCFELLSLSVCLSLQTSACPQFDSLCFTSYVCLLCFKVCVCSTVCVCGGVVLAAAAAAAAPRPACCSRQRGSSK